MKDCGVIRHLAVILITCLATPALFRAVAVADDGIKSEADGSGQRLAMHDRYRELGELVHGGSVTPHFLMDGNRFWYAEGTPDHVLGHAEVVQAYLGEPDA